MKEGWVLRLGGEVCVWGGCKRREKWRAVIPGGEGCRVGEFLLGAEDIRMKGEAWKYTP